MKHALAILLILSTTCAFAGGWHQFHGPNRDNKSPDTGLLKEWPEGGPARLWEASGIGEGYSTVAVVGDRIYTTGEIDGDCVITALDVDGNAIWTRTNGKAWDGSYPGTRSTPTVVDGLLYHLSGVGNLICLKAGTGKVVWSVNIFERFDGRNITWGLAESPLVVGDKVICTPGGKEVSMAALDRMTGETVWTCKGAGDRPGYASPILVDCDGLQQIVTAMSESIVGVRASDGETTVAYTGTQRCKPGSDHGCASTSSPEKRSFSPPCLSPPTSTRTVASLTPTASSISMRTTATWSWRSRRTAVLKSPAS